MRNLVEVKHETKEAVFEVLGTDGAVETYKVGQLSMRCKYKHGINLISSPLYTSVAIILDYAPHFS